MIPAQHRRQDDGAQGAGDGEDHAVAVERAALVIVVGHLGGEGVVADVHGGEDGIKQDKGEGIVDGQPDLAQGGHQPHHDERQAQRDGAEQEQHPAAPPTAADPVRDQTEEGVVDGVPEAADAATAQAA